MAETYQSVDTPLQRIPLLAGVSSLVAITPSDSTDQATAAAPIQALYAAADGTAKLTLAGDSTAVTVPVFAGLNRLRVKRVWATPAPPSLYAATLGG